MNKNYFPILLDITNFKCLVIGGGMISYRKIMNLLEFDAEVTCLSPVFCKKIENLIEQSKINFIKREYQENDVHNYQLVFCATGVPEVEQLIKNDCDKYKILLNVADVPDLCHFIMPATIKKGYLTVSIASQGKSPFFVKHLKDEIANSLNPNLEQISILAAKFREILISNPNLTKEIQDTLIEKFLKTDWPDIINSQGEEEAYKKMKEFFIFAVL